MAGRTDQQYGFIPAGEKNVYFIRLKNRDLYFTPSDNKGTVDARILFTKKTGSRLQQWTLIEQHPEM